ncbi:MAG: hypothetical protein EF813_01845 [Methanosarcinales archaeon]|nr:MAG: hypothetical protein EF813_01845 [Methanosarcinales archaeon]
MKRAVIIAKGEVQRVGYRDTCFNEFKVTAGNVGIFPNTPCVKVAVADVGMVQIAKYILLGGGTCPGM